MGMPVFNVSVIGSIRGTVINDTQSSLNASRAHVAANNMVRRAEISASTSMGRGDRLTIVIERVG